MNNDLAIIVSIICVTILIIVILLVVSRAKLTQQKALQKLMEKDQEIDLKLLDSVGLGSKHQPNKDFRRGVLFISSGGVLTVIFYNMGGVGWMFGFLPIVIGLVYLLFWSLDRKKV